MSEEQPTLHPLVELMIARMASHPEEFREDYFGSPIKPPPAERWRPALVSIDQHGTEREKQLIAEARRGILMDQAHEWAMDELLNGDERRAKAQQDELDYMMKMQQQAMSQATLSQQAAIAQAQLNAAYPHGAHQTGISSSSGSYYPLATATATGVGGGGTLQKLTRKVLGK